MKKQFLLILFLAIGSISYAQTYVSSGDGTLSAAITAASSGDVLLLNPGETYSETTGSNFGTIDKAITIEVDGGESATKPILKLLGTAGTNNFFMLTNGGSLTLRGLEFDGNQNGTPNAAHLAQFTRTGGTGTGTYNVAYLKVENCNVHDFTSNILDGGSSAIKPFSVDSVFVLNTIMTNVGTPVYFKYNGAKYVKVQNSTFNTVLSYGVRIAGTSSTGIVDAANANYTPTVLIDHTTWYNVGTTDPREIILSDASSGSGEFLNPWTVTNSIFQKQVSGAAKTVINLKGTTGDALGTVTNCCWFDVGKRTWYNNTVHDTLNQDPQFANAASGDFTLPGGSNLQTFSTTSGAIGDPRWSSNPTAIDNNPIAVPATFSLKQNYPNPFNPSTKITFNVEKTGFTSLKVYNLLGQEVVNLLSENLSAGEHTVNFNAVNLPTGVYIYRLTSGSQSISKKMILLK